MQRPRENDPKETLPSATSESTSGDQGQLMFSIRFMVAGQEPIAASGQPLLLWCRGRLEEYERCESFYRPHCCILLEKLLR